MLVKAIRLGYYNHRRRREGASFELEDSSHFSNKWMVKINSDARVPIEFDGKKEVISAAELAQEEKRAVGRPRKEI